MQYKLSHFHESHVYFKNYFHMLPLWVYSAELFSWNLSTRLDYNLTLVAVWNERLQTRMPFDQRITIRLHVSSQSFAKWHWTYISWPWLLNRLQWNKSMYKQKWSDLDSVDIYHLKTVKKFMILHVYISPCVFISDKDCVITRMVSLFICC